MIVYYKLENILKERGMIWKDLCNAGISVNMPVKFSQNRLITTETIDKVCTYLKVQPGDIMEWVEDESEAERKQIEAQIAELQAKLKQMQSAYI